MKDTEGLSKEPLDECLVAKVAHMLQNGRSLIHRHRDYCGHGLDYHDGRIRLLEVTDGEYGLDDSKVLFSWEDEEAFIAFFTRQSDYSMSGADENEKLFYTADAFLLNNQRLTKERFEQNANFRYEEKYVEFFRALTCTQSPARQEELENALLQHDNEVEYAIQNTLTNETTHLLFALDVIDKDCFAYEAIQNAKEIGINESYESREHEKLFE